MVLKLGASSGEITRGLWGDSVERCGVGME